MDSREFRLRECDYSIGDTIYCVVGEDALYSIKKTRIIGSETRHSGFRFGNALALITSYTGQKTGI